MSDRTRVVFLFYWRDSKRARTLQSMSSKTPADRAIACTATGRLSGLPKWELLPGMLVADPRGSGAYRITDVDNGRIYVIDTDFGHGPCEWIPAAGVRPIFSDELTLHGLLVLVRRAWKGHLLEIRIDDELDVARIVVHKPGVAQPLFDSDYGPLDEVGVAALEAAPVQR